MGFYTGKLLLATPAFAAAVPGAPASAEAIASNAMKKLRKKSDDTTTGQIYKMEMRSGGAIAFRLPLWQKMWVGAVSGGVGAAMVFPLDTIKTRLQASTGSSVSSIARELWQAGGPRAFLRGLVPNVIGVMPEKAIKLGVNEQFRDILTPDRRNETVYSQVLAGVGTAVFQVTITNPYEVVKLNMQLLQKANAAADAAGVPRPTAQSAGALVRELGPRGLYKGSGICLVRDIPYNALFFPTYIFLKRYLTDDEGNVSQVSILGSGMVAGSTAAALCTPADVVKTRLQRTGSPYKSAIECARHVLRTEGPAAFTRGALMRASISGPLYGLALLCFELQSKWFAMQTLPRDPSLELKPRTWHSKPKAWDHF